ncbi:MFS transporter [Salmonella enterica subsp. enterica]|nr:MFS transporter [Salmonella enterica subsp. enterica]
MEHAEDKSIKRNNLIFFILLAVGGGTIFKAMYLREVFYYPWNEYFSLTNTQSGMLMSWLGFVGIISGAVSGIIVDRFKNPKSILTIAYLTMAALAIWQSFRPSYQAMFIIVGFMSFVGNGLFLVSMTKIARLLASDNEQGRYFGFLESGRGIAGTVLTLCAVAIVGLHGSSSISIGFILRFDAAIYITLGFTSYCLFPKGVSAIENAAPKKMSDLISLLKSVKLWLAAFIISCVIFVYQGGAYLVPYLSDAYGMTPDQTAVIGMIRAYFLAFIISPFAGLLADKIGSSLKVMASFFILGALITASFIFIPHDSRFLILLITLVLLLGALTFGMRGIMYAQVNEIRIPKVFTGTAMGILICIGFSPEAYVHLIFGYLLDTYKEFAYTLMFATIAVVLFAGALCSGLLYRINKKV